jgi:hypothetical protein
MTVFRNSAVALRAMRSAMRSGLDPRNSADAFGAKYSRAWNDYNRRQSEHWANKELSHAAVNHN